MINPFPLHAQDGIPHNTSFAEKIYLQLDNRIYTTDQTIWFKAIVTLAKDHTPTNVTGVLHVELIDPNERIVDHKIIRLENGIGTGFFQLDQQYVAGSYLVRSYTEWNKNFGQDFFFTQYIQLFPSSVKPTADPVKNIRLFEEGNNERRISASLDPFTIDSLHSKELTLMVTFDNRTDTFSIKKDNNNRYQFDHSIPEGCHFMTLQIETKNLYRYTKTIVLEKDYLDLQFFPESGEYVQGMPAVVGFKALDSSGKGKITEGEIVNARGEIITHFKSNPLGMGTILLNRVDTAEKFVARVMSRDGVQKIIPLPLVRPKGYMLSVKKGVGIINIQASSNDKIDDSVFVRASCRGTPYLDAKGRLHNGRLAFTLLSDSLPEGIIDFTLMNASMHPVAERLYFNVRPETRLNLSVSTDKISYVQREPTTISVNINDSILPGMASVSLLVVNKTIQGKTLNARQHILSYFLLSSDLKGEIEDPGFYFDPTTNHDNDLDALLLTQGWRKYKYNGASTTLSFQPETNLSVSGTVKGGLFNRKGKKGTELTMMTFGNSPTVQEQTADSLGRFSFPLEEYGQDVNILIQTKNSAGTEKNYAVTIDKKNPPPVLYQRMNSVETPDSFITAYVKQNIERKKAEDAFTAATEGVTLGEVVVKSYFMTPERKLVADKYGKPKTVIEGDAIRAKEAKWSYGLYSVLMFNFPDKVRVTRMSDGVLYASLYNRDPTLVVVDGIAVRAHDYSLIPAIPPSEVKSFELIENAKNFRNLFCEALPEACGFNTPTVGNVIAIYTYGRKGIFGANAPVGISKMSIPVFATPREFYAPKHMQLKADDWLKPDMRNLIHWQPYVTLDSLGKGSVQFFNADITGTMQIIVEAISQDGTIGYKELLYEVGKRNKNE